MKRRLVLVALFLALFPPILASCGYRFSGGGEAVDRSIQSVYVDAFINSTAEPMVENYVRNAFITEFRRSGRFSIAGSADDADAILSGTVRNIRTSRSAYRIMERAVEDKVYMRLQITFKERNGNVLWSHNGLEDSEAFLVGDDPLFTERNRSQALKKLASDLAELAYRGIMAGF